MTTGRGRRRSSSVPSKDDFVPHSSPQGPLKSTDGKVDPFKLRVAAQRFMNENGPLFRALAKSAAQPNDVLKDGSLPEVITRATDLATRIAVQFTGKEKPEATEINPFRFAAANIIAQAWESGRIKEVDLDLIAAQHKEAFNLVDEALDRNMFGDLSLSDEASLSMTASGVALTLMKPVMTYDFRQDPSEILSDLSGVVLAMSNEIVSQILPENHKPDDKRSLIQTTANKLSDIMASLYERKTRQFLEHISTLEEQDREEFISGYDPVPDISKSFREWAIILGGVTINLSNGLNGQAKSQDSGEMKPAA